MKALLLVAHGSRREASNHEVMTLARTLGAAVAGDFDIVEGAFLEIARPTIDEGIQCCINQGARSVVVVPYFLAAGTHVVNDIPGILAAARVRHPGATFSLTPHIGASPLMTDLIRGCAAAQGEVN